MADRLHLRVYTPERVLADATVREVTAPGADGEIGVLPDHAALATALGAGVLSYRTETGSMVRIRVEGGFAEVRDNQMIVLAEAGEILAAA
jgi:F-type H+-transporting ATPase subunit epsilon